MIRLLNIVMFSLFVAGILMVVPVTAQDPQSDFAALFDYDQSQPLGVQEIGSEQRGDVIIQDITFPSPVTGDPISAYVVSPVQEGIYAGVLFVHWLGNPRGNREEFLEEALAMADKGTVSLLVDAMWAHGWFGARDGTTDYEDSIKQVIELRRAIDVLIVQPNVDLDRLAVVGHDFGAMYSAVALAADGRIDTLVFIAGTSRFITWFDLRTTVRGEARDVLVAKLLPINPVTVMDYLKGDDVFLQFALGDSFVSKEAQIELYSAGSVIHTRIATYTDLHTMQSEIVPLDRQQWLAERLKLEQ